MRRLYREHLASRLRHADLPWIARHATRYLAIRLSGVTHRAHAGPILGTLVTNYSCNLRCRMCDLPLRVPDYKRDGLESLDTDAMLEVIDDFASIGTLGLGFTGGEPLMRKDITTLLERSKKRRMVTHLNTNGTFVDDDAVTAWLDLGLDSVNLSLDGAAPETHDAIRGKDGSHAEVLSAATRVLDARRKLARTIPRVKIVCVLSAKNLDDAERLVALRREIGADSIDFIPVHDFDQPDVEREHPNANGQATPEARRIRDVTDRLLELSRHEPIDNSPEHLALFPAALAGDPSPLRCFAGYNSLVVDGYGRIFPCVPWSNFDRAVGDVRTTRLRDFWKSSDYAAKRREIESCRDCFLNCQTELNLLFQRAPRNGARAAEN